MSGTCLFRVHAYLTTLLFMMINSHDVTGEMRCYCNEASCISTGYMCKSQLNLCYVTTIQNGLSNVVVTQGCAETMSHRDLELCFGSNDVAHSSDGLSTELSWNKEEKLGGKDTDWKGIADDDGDDDAGDVDMLQTTTSVGRRTSTRCCSQDMCNGVVGSEDRDVDVLQLGWKTNSSLLALMSDDEGRRVDTSQSRGRSSSRGTDEEWRQRDLWFKAAMIAVPIAGLSVLGLLVLFAVRVLSSDVRRHHLHHHHSVFESARDTSARGMTLTKCSCDGCDVERGTCDVERGTCDVERGTCDGGKSNMSPRNTPRCFSLSRQDKRLQATDCGLDYCNDAYDARRLLTDSYDECGDDCARRHSVGVGQCDSETVSFRDRELVSHVHGCVISCRRCAALRSTQIVVAPNHIYPDHCESSRHQRRSKPRSTVHKPANQRSDSCATNNDQSNVEEDKNPLGVLDKTVSCTDRCNSYPDVATEQECHNRLDRSWTATACPDIAGQSATSNSVPMSQTCPVDQSPSTIHVARTH